MKAVVRVLVGLVLLVPVIDGVDAQPVFNENHYLVYRVEALPPPTISTMLELYDQFGDYMTNELTLEYFANPVMKFDEPVFDVNLHHTWWRIDNPQPERDVIIENQFGPRVLRVRDGRYLLAPSLKDVPGGELPQANHYECYEAEGMPVGFEVPLTDQFGNSTPLVMEPEWFCNPVRKTHDGVVYEPVDLEIHLTCYRLEPPVPMERDALAIDQFGFWELGIREGLWLCVPTEKFDFVPTERSTWGRIKSVFR
jgi:hypothetical protein